jgi:hypothetical protein
VGAEPRRESFSRLVAGCLAGSLIPKLWVKTYLAQVQSALYAGVVTGWSLSFTSPSA